MRPYEFFLLHWFLAMAGLSVYFTFDLNLCSMILGIYCGHHLKEMRQRMPLLHDQIVMNNF